MRKLRLDLDTLAVASFETEDAEAGRATVQGHLIPTNPWCAANTYRTYCPNSVCTCPPPP
ncbi:MAG TPA: hypothetical protein VHG08_08475 [Longimicrobium sp.]|nr:hypothetical protein [Longimicrobium sp.]